MVFFGKLAEIAGEYLRKGAKVYIEGKLHTRKWQDKSGQDKYTTEVVVDSFSGTMKMLDSRNDGGGQSTQTINTRAGNKVAALASAPPVAYEDDIPF